MIRRLPPVAAVVGSVLLAPSATAEPPDRGPRDLPCGDYTSLVEALERRYQEVPVSVGLENNGQLVEVFASRRSGTWTILATRPDGTSCVMAVGEHFEQRRPRSDGSAGLIDRTRPDRRPG